jgi:hypothetical protein
VSKAALVEALAWLHGMSEVGGRNVSNSRSPSKFGASPGEDRKVAGGLASLQVETTSDPLQCLKISVPSDDYVAEHLRR